MGRETQDTKVPTRDKSRAAEKRVEAEWGICEKSNAMLKPLKPVVAHELLPEQKKGLPPSVQ
eukprot:9197168-Pyramimonas_sp.AAC.1